MDYKYFMEQAYNQALLAYELNEVPIGCVIVLDNTIIGKGFNKRNTKKNPLCHAEIESIDQGAKYMNDWRLEDCTLFVTVEPCPMCAGAIVQARIKEVVFAAKNKKAGCAGSVLNIFNNSSFNHQVNIVSGVLEEKCSLLMKEYFKTLR